ncbi:MAG: metallophosphoesterase [Hyphomicrobiales bacterium]
MRRQWVISDIHGCYKTLKTLLEDRIVVTDEDSLFFLGDYIDKGDNNKEVLDYLLNLERSSIHCVFLRGNHEDYCLKAYDEEKELIPDECNFYSNVRLMEWFSHGGLKTLMSFNTQAVEKIPSLYINWMRQLQYYIELDKFLLVHAGFNCNMQDIFEDKNYMLYSKECTVDKVKTKGKIVVHGHVPLKINNIISQFDQKEKCFNIYLDNGVYMKDIIGFGNLIALELNTFEIVIQPCIDKIVD